MSEIRPVYGLPGEDAGDEQEDVARRVLPVPLLILVVGLAVAAIWFVARPALDESPPAAPPCEKVVVSGVRLRAMCRPGDARFAGRARRPGLSRAKVQARLDHRVARLTATASMLRA